MSRATLIGVLLAAVAASGCSKLVPKLDEVLPDTRKTYQKAETLPDLEVPPDLSTEAIRDRMAVPEGGQAARFSTYQERRAERQREQELETSENSAIRVLENEHVLAVDGATVQVWPKLRDFMVQEGYALELDDVELGVIETGWNEDSAELKREKFKIFAEAGEAKGTTVLYVSHEAQEMVPEGEDLVWKRSPRNTKRERALVDRLQVFMGGGELPAVAAASDTPAPRAAPAREEAAAEPAAAEAADDGDDDYTREDAEADYARARAEDEAADEADEVDEEAGIYNGDDELIGGAAPSTGSAQRAELVSVGGGKVYLTLDEEFPTAWKTTARALEQVGVQVKDSDKGRGVYLVELGGGGGGDDGMLGKLKFWGSDGGAEFQVSLTGVGDKTEVVVLDRDGRWETGDEAGALLGKLQDALNRERI